MMSLLPLPPAAIAHDGYTNTLYWSIEGGQGDVYMSDDSLLLDEAIRLYENRDNPFALEYDWLSKRLLWVEEGERVSVVSR